MWKILQETVYKTRITDLDISTTPLANGCGNDDMIQLGPLRNSECLFQFVQITDAYFVCYLSGTVSDVCSHFSVVDGRSSNSSSLVVVVTSSTVADVCVQLNNAA